MESTKKFSMTIAIREFNYPSDYESVFRLWESAGEGIGLGTSDEPQEIAKKIQHDPDLALIAEVDGSLAGTVFGGFDGRRGLVYHLAVDAKFREAGIGSQLMDELETRLQAKGCLKVYLLVKKDNQAALSFYEKRGWGEMNNVLLYGKKLS